MLHFRVYALSDINKHPTNSKSHGKHDETATTVAPLIPETPGIICSKHNETAALGALAAQNSATNAMK